MNTRQALQANDAPPVLDVSISSSRNRFIVGTAEGLRVFRSDNCLTTYQPRLSFKENLTDGGIAVTAIHDDRYLAFVGGGRLPHGKESIMVFWDAVLGKDVASFDFREPILGLRLAKDLCVITLMDRTVIMKYQELKGASQPSTAPAEQLTSGSALKDRETMDEILKAPNKVAEIIATSPNPYALVGLSHETMVLPAKSAGQVQLVPLAGGSKRVVRAHTTSLRALCLSDDGSLLATASEKGTLIRVFSTKTLDQVAEFRRGMDAAITFLLAISPGNRWLASTSDKGTLHIFDLRPPTPPAEPTPSTKDRSQRKSGSYVAHRLPTGHYDRESLSGASTGRSSPSSITPSHAHQYPPGSVQEYYGLRPPPASASPPGMGPGISAMAALKASPLAPKVFRDIKSVSNTPFSMGNETPHWQGGPSHSWTTTPSGLRKRVNKPVLPLPAEPSGKPTKGIVVFAPSSQHGMSEEDGAMLYVVGGGTDARWEKFRLLPVEGGGWTLINDGFRRYMTPQFID